MATSDDIYAGQQSTTSDDIYGAGGAYVAPTSEQMSDIIRRSASKYGIAENLLRAVGLQESGLGATLDYRGRGDSGHGYGVFQLDDQLGRGMSGPGRSRTLLDRVVKDPQFAADYAAQMLQSLLARYKGNERLALAAYNGGPGAPNLKYADEVMKRMPAMSQGTPAPATQPRTDDIYANAKTAATTVSNPMDQPSGETGEIGGALNVPAFDNKKHSVLQELFGVTEYPFALGNAMAEGRLSGGGEFSKLGGLKGSPANVADRLGYNAKPFLQYVVANTKPNDWEHIWAQGNLDHPYASGAETFIAEFLNPGNIATGKGVGKLGNLMRDFLSQSEKGRSFLNVLSPYRGIAKVAGDEGKHGLMSTVSAAHHVDDLAMHEATRVFKDLTRSEQIDVVRRMQSLGPSSVKPNPAAGNDIVEFMNEAKQMRGNINNSKHDLNYRAYLLNQALRGHTRRLLGEGILPESSVYDEAMYFPMRGAYRNPNLNDTEFDFIGGLRGDNSGVVHSEPIFQKHFHNIDEAINSGMLKNNWSPANQLYRHLSRGEQNIAAERGFARLPETLIQDTGGVGATIKGSAETVPDIVERRGGPTLPGEYTQTQIPPPPPDIHSNIFYRSGKNALVPQGGEQIEPFKPVPEEDIYKTVRTAAESGKEPRSYNRPPEGWVSADEALGGKFLLPSLKGKWIKSEFADWLKNHGGSMLSGTPQKFFGSEKAASWLNYYNTSMRQAIIANPGYHLLWNIAWNGASAMGQSPAHLVHFTGRAIVGAARSIVPGFDKLAVKYGESKLGQMFTHGADQYAQDVQEAMRAGATAEFGHTREVFGGENGADLLTRPYSDLTFTGKMNKFFTMASDWNKRAVFGPNGEQAFATTLYKRMLERGESSGRAMEITREALGNYQNVDPNNVFSQMFFFYPWLKSNTIHWLKTFLTNPSYTSAPLQATRRANQLAGDPNQSGPYPTPDFELYSKGAGGAPSYWTPAIPQRVAGELVDTLAAKNPDDLTKNIGRDPSEFVNEAAKISESHANAVLRVPLSLIVTALQKNSVDPDLPANYNFIYDKDAPPDVIRNQIGRFLLTNSVPLPLIQYALQDTARLGITPQRFAEGLAQSLGGGYFHERQTTAQNKAIYRARGKLEKTLSGINRAQYPPEGSSATPISAESADKQRQRAYQAYAEVRDEILKSKPQRTEPSEF